MPYLVTVSGSRIPLRRGQEYVIGRGMDCDVVVEDGACSRRHAKISVAPNTDTAFVEDLDSRNGTFLSGERVASKIAAREGSRVQVGASIFLVRLKDQPEEIDLAETGTIAFDEVVANQDLDGGELSRIGLLDLLTRMFNSQRNVTVHVAMPEDEHARVEVRNGEVHAADCAGLKGFNALVKLGREKTGIFWLVETEESCPRNVHEHGARLIADLARCLDPATAPRR